METIDNIHEYLGDHRSSGRMPKWHKMSILSKEIHHYQNVVVGSHYGGFYTANLD